MRRAHAALALVLALLVPGIAPPAAPLGAAIAHADPATTKVRRAIRNTDPVYLEKVLAQRNPGNIAQRGSVFIRPVTRMHLARAKWKRYAHAAVGAGTEAFIAPIPGRVGVLELADLPPDTPVRFEDPKGLGALSAVVTWSGPLPWVRYSVLIVGRESGRPTVYTVHPGDPVIATRGAARVWLGKTVRADQALELGFTLAKADLGVSASSQALVAPSN